MINAPQLLKDLKAILGPLEDDIRSRAEEVPELRERLQAEHKTARDAKRTSSSFSEWQDDQVTQAAVAWILGCVFVRFIEDNGLIPEPWIAGPGDRLAHAKDQHSHYFRQHPRETDREYLVYVFDQVRCLPAMAELFDKAHNPIWFMEPSGDGAELLRTFFQKIDATEGGLVHDFSDPDWNTRFLGDLYQDLSENARKKYALLQTPDFVEEFILDRTLDPAIETFGLKGLRMIDPTCGSGHFLLGSFQRVLEGWQLQEPGSNIRELVQRSLSSVYGVDLNPFSIAISRFRLLVAALKASDIHRLKDAPNFHFNLAVGDSLLHGFETQQLLTGGSELDEVGHVYQTEDAEQLLKIFTQQYHAVVGNPPYILVKDKLLNQHYRDRYLSCAGKYSLVVPFMERFFGLAQSSDEDSGQPAGYMGQITANSFMKRQFGKKLIQEFLPRWDLTQAIDTSGCYIPGHGTPTVILFGRNQRPVDKTVRMALGIKGEPGTPEDAAEGLAWSSIVQMIDSPGSENEFISVADRSREILHKHPWSIGGGGASELKVLLDEVADAKVLKDIVECVSIGVVTAEDETFAQEGTFLRKAKQPVSLRKLIEGEALRDWKEPTGITILYPYSKESADPEDPGEAKRLIWPFKTNLNNRIWFRQKHKDRDMHWWEYAFLSKKLALAENTLSLAFVATHNHFVFDRGGKVFNRSAPVIKLDPKASENDHFRILGPINSSTAGFWMKQVLQGKHKGDGGDAHATPEYQRFEFDSTKLKRCPLPSGFSLTLAQNLDNSARELSKQDPQVLAEGNRLNENSLQTALSKSEAIRGRMIALQEELDWQCYRLYELAEATDNLEWPEDKLEDLPLIQLGERPFEILMARKMAAGELETSWFERHGSVPCVGIPEHFSSELRKLWERRIAMIENNKNINLIERPEYKRRWNTESWDKRQERALEAWLQNRLEFVLSGRDLMAEARSDQEEPGKTTRDPELLSCAQLADRLRPDSNFMEVAALYRGREDFDLVKLVSELVGTQGVPNLPVLRYKPSGLRKRKTWEETWELQRREDAVEAEVRGQKSGVIGQGAVVIGQEVIGQAAEKELKVLIREAQAKAVGDIPVPPKYKSTDFQKAVWWKLRGKLDVPKERYVLFPTCERDGDDTPVLTWAGWDHLEQAQAIAGYYEQVRNEGWSDERRLPLLAGVLELVPWLKQWHNDYNAAYATHMGDFFAEFVEDEARAMGKTLQDVRSWTL